MILNRIIQSIRSGNLTTLTIELVIVVVGVFMGIQVSNWNDERKDQALAVSYLHGIQADLEADIDNYEDRLNFWQQVSDYGATGLGFAQSGADQGQAEWPVLLAYFQASQLGEFYTTKTTYEELKSEGALGLISNRKLRNLLSQYYTNADNPALSVRPAYREHVRGRIPLDIQTYIWENCYQSNRNGQQQLIDCGAPGSGAEYGTIISEISSDRALMSELRYWMSSMHVATLMGRDRLALARSIRDFVDQELGQ